MLCMYVATCCSLNGFLGLTGGGGGHLKQTDDSKFNFPIFMHITYVCATFLELKASSALNIV